MLNVPENINQVIEEFVNGVKEILGDNLKKIILYGSYARGDYNENSDIDIMILTNLEGKELKMNRDKIYDYCYDIEEKNNFHIDVSPLVKNIDRFNYWLEALPFYMNVQKEGVVLSES